jgi:two-component system response regulator FixJ
MNTHFNPSAQRRDVKHSNEIFVVDDDDCVRDILSSILSLEGFPVTCFEDGETFLEKASERMPVCLFLDVVMPGRSGLQVLKELNARRYAAPIFLVSARDDTALVVEALRNGGADFLRKPFDPYTAVQRVRDAVEIWNIRDEKSAPEPEAELGPGPVRLTRLEASEVLAQVVRGVSSKEIGRILGIEKRTVEYFRVSIMKKFGAKNAADLMRIVMS